MALIHVFAFLAQEGIAPIADPNLMIGLEFMTPVTIDADEGVAHIARYLHLLTLVTVQARVGRHMEKQQAPN